MCNIYDYKFIFIYLTIVIFLRKYTDVYGDVNLLFTKSQGKVTEYGQCPNTDTLGISETINPTKNVVLNNIFIII